MYTTTFYSFKGGVGRTMALANVAVELANRGRKVIAADFDLEAPGLDSFDLLRPKNPSRGIVDFVLHYRDTGEAPDVADFLYEVPGVGREGGQLWVMPAGSPQRDYGGRFRDIDWAELYARRDGYLLFEDLKAQWDQKMGADWVLVDSRTGHTDTGGICTRQLPDAVVAVFFPNRQNLNGLARVVHDIREEARGSREKQITLHFVMSNVPDLDDEDEILRSQIQSFRNELAMESDPLVVHRYDSLALLNQAIFIHDRPKSRLATEYRALADEIVRGNLADRDGALSWLRPPRDDLPPLPRILESPDEKEQALLMLEKNYHADGEVLAAISRRYRQEWRREEEARLIDLAVGAGCLDTDILLRRSRWWREKGDSAGATADALHALEGDSAEPWDVVEALHLADATAEELLETPRVRSLDATDRSIVGSLLFERGDHRIAIALLESLDDLESYELARNSLTIMYIGSGRCADAAALLRRGGRGVEDMPIQDAFNYGMALWGADGVLREEPFRRVVRLAGSGERGDGDPNHLQCLAVAYRVTGDRKAAEQSLRASREAIGDGPGRSWLSCWRYGNVSRKEFLEDLDDIEEWISGDDSRRPRFLTSAEQAVAGHGSLAAVAPAD